MLLHKKSIGLTAPKTANERSPVLVKKRIVHGFIVFFRYLFLLALSYVVLFQLFYMISYAIRPVSDTFDPSVVWLPSRLTAENFKDAFSALEFVPSLVHSLTIGQISAIIEVFVCSVIAYGFARFHFREKNLVFFLVIITIIVPTPMLIVPMYLNYSHFDILGILNAFREWTGVDLRINLLNTGWTFYLPSLFGVGLRSGLFIYIYRKFFEKLPRELEEAAYVDGAGPLQTFFRVIMPSSGVVFLTVTIFSVIWHWNESYMAGMYMTDNKPLAVMLENFANAARAAGSDSRNARMAACLLFILPMLLMYAVMQRKFVQSIDRVGIVG